LPTVPLSKPENVRPFPAGPDTAALVMPARGRVVRLYGQRDDDGASSKGISISTRAAAQVVAPYDGRIAYAGTFRSYGQILIIEHGGRYHTLLAGVDRIDAVVGQWVLAGEPIGVMSGGSTAAAAGASTSDSAGEAQGHPELYLELRRNGQPINPLPWLAKTSDKVQG
jgi:septal ring factor EnvC (AmiA/AmiB activator)